MTSSVDIVNLALGRIKQSTIASLTEETAEAEAANRLYPIARDFVLADFPWRVNTSMQTLAALTNDRSDDWGYKYQRPTCLRFYRVWYASGRPNARLSIPCEINSAGIYTDVEDARGVIGTQETDTTLYSPALANCIAWRLANELVMPLEGDLSLQQVMLRGYVTEKANAWATDASELVTMDDGRDGLSDLIACRG